MLFVSKIPTAFLILSLFMSFAARTTAGEAKIRWLVTMKGEALVPAMESGAIHVPTSASGKPDLTSPEAVRHLAEIERVRRRAEDRLVDVAPGALVEYRFSILHNGIVVSGADRPLLERLPGVVAVRRTDTFYVTPGLDTTLDLLNVPAFWSIVGGESNAGEGVKIAVIDSGINVDNPFFSPDGFVMPAGFPKGEIAFTTEKVIAARAYFRSYDPPDPEKDTENPIDHGGHGSHCAGIAAGVSGTVFDLSGTPISVSGVAPAAYLMNYKVFYNATSGQEGAFDTELMAAFEDAVADGADVISCSWGGADNMLEESVPGQIYQAALDAGAVVVFAAGNEGSGPGTVGHPGTLPRVLTVASMSAGRYFGGFVDVVSPEPVPSQLLGIAAIKGSISPSFEGAPLGPWPLISARTAGEGLNNDGCGPYPFGSLDGAVALIERGNCPFSLKVDNAYLAGASAVIIYNNVDGEAAITMGGDAVDIPAVQIGNEEGIAVEKWAIENQPGAAVSIHDTMAPYLEPQNVEVMAGSSSRGPTDVPLLKPEIAATGVQVLSADAHWPGSDAAPWGLKSGTSMACPHVSGAAALVRQKYPGLPPEHVQAILVGSARIEYGSGDTTTTTDVGAGIMDLGRAAVAGAYTVPPTLSMGEGTLGETFEATVSMYDTYWYAPSPVAHWEHENGEPIVAVPGEGELVDISGDTLTAFLHFAETAKPGEHTGRLVLKGVDSDLVVPYHARIMPDEEEELLILDMSFLQQNQKLLVDFYTSLAQEAWLDYRVLRVPEEGPAPTLAELLPHGTVLVFTGNDQVYQNGGVAVRTLDALSSYARKGGNLIVAGQGPLRGNGHKRIHGFLGAAVIDSYPLFDPYTQDVVELEHYLVAPPEGDGGLVMIDKPIDIGPQTDGIGDLEFVGDLSAYMGSGLPDVFSRPFLLMDASVFSGGQGVLGMAFDPYTAYGVLPEMEALRGRAVLMGFGFERIGSGTDQTASASELFEAVYPWVSERIELVVSAQSEDLGVILDLDAGPAQPVSYEIDFGDGSETIVTDYEEIYHEYADYGPRDITVTVRAPLGAADVERLTVDIEPPAEEDGGVDSDTGDAHENWGDPEYDDRVRDCGCATVGAGQGSGDSLLLFLCLFFGCLLLADPLTRQ